MKYTPHRKVLHFKDVDLNDLSLLYITDFLYKEMFGENSFKISQQKFKL
jgi:hypothetical protein